MDVCAALELEEEGEPEWEMSWEGRVEGLCWALVERDAESAGVL